MTVPILGFNWLLISSYNVKGISMNALHRFAGVLRIFIRLAWKVTALALACSVILYTIFMVIVLYGTVKGNQYLVRLGESGAYSVVYFVAAVTSVVLIMLFVNLTAKVLTFIFSKSMLFFGIRQPKDIDLEDVVAIALYVVVMHVINETARAYNVPEPAILVLTFATMIAWLGIGIAAIWIFDSMLMNKYRK